MNCKEDQGGHGHVQGHQVDKANPNKQETSLLAAHLPRPHHLVQAQAQVRRVAVAAVAVQAVVVVKNRNSKEDDHSSSRTLEYKSTIRSRVKSHC